MTPFVDRSKVKAPATLKQRQTAVDITAEDIIPRLTPQNVADLVLISMVSVFIDFLFEFLFVTGLHQTVRQSESLTDGSQVVWFNFTGDVARPASSPFPGNLHPHRCCRDRGTDKTHGAPTGQSAHCCWNGQGHRWSPARGSLLWNLQHLYKLIIFFFSENKPKHHSWP